MHRLSKSKAQFFIISAALVIASISIISFYLQSLYRPSLTYASTKIELDYIPQIEKTLCEAAKNKGVFAQNIFEKNLEEVENELKKYLASQGIVFSVSHKIQNDKVIFQFNLTSPGFKSKTDFEC